jgi:hypothetical protein
VSAAMMPTRTTTYEGGGDGKSDGEATAATASWTT